MKMITENGPRLEDAEFFGDCVRHDRPGLSELAAAVAAEKWQTARSLFAQDLRNSLRTDSFFAIDRSFANPTHMLPGESIAEAGERILGNRLVSTSTLHDFGDEVDWFANPTYNQYREWTWQLNRHVDWAILGQRYRETGDERFAEGWARLVRSWLEQTAVEPLNAPSNATYAWRTIETGIRMGGSWQWALHSFIHSPHFDDDLLVDWAKSVWEHGWRLRNVHHSHNWLIMEQNGLAQIGIIYPQFQQAEEWKRFAFDILADELNNQVYPDGMQYELSTGYHQVNIRNYEWLWDVAEAYDEPVLEDFQIGLEPMYEANIKLMMPDGRLPDLNDGGWHRVAPLMAKAARRYPHRPDFLWAASAGEEGMAPAQLSTPLSYSGLFVMRNSWQYNGIWALFDGGPFGYAHQHEDKLNLLLHAYGAMLLTEAGNYAYDDSEMRRYVLSTRAHNTVRVDGAGQNRRRTFNRDLPSDLSQKAEARWFSGERYDIVEATYDEGYGEAGEIEVHHKRTVIFLREGIRRPDGEPALEPALLVVDRLMPRMPYPDHEYEAIWHLNASSVERIGFGLRAQTENGVGLGLLATDPGETELRVAQGEESPEWQGWRSIGNHQQGEFEAIPTALFRWVWGGPLRVVTLIYPMKDPDSWQVDRIEAGSQVRSTAIHLHLEDGSRIFLDERDFPFE